MRLTVWMVAGRLAWLIAGLRWLGLGVRGASRSAAALSLVVGWPIAPSWAASSEGVQCEGVEAVRCREAAELARFVAIIQAPNTSTEDYVRATEEHARLEKEFGMRRLEAAGCMAKRTIPAFNACSEKALEGLTFEGAMAAEWPGRKAILDAEAEAREGAQAKREAAEAKRRVAAASQALASCKAKRYKAGTVYIGMTRDEAVFCGWGDPERVNRTIRARSVSEQWIYGVGTYLYFENGRLTTIQD